MMSTTMPEMRRTMRVVAAAGVALVLAGAACQDGDRDDPAVDPGPAPVPAPPAQEPDDGDPPAEPEPTGPPAADAFLPPLPGFRVDDDIDAGEIRASLDHGDIPYREVRRRLMVDEDGFAAGDIMVVTFEPGADGPARFLRHWFGDADREPVEVAGEAMLRVAAEPHEALAWTGRGFVVVFSRGQALTDERLEEAAGATVAGWRER